MHPVLARYLTLQAAVDTLTRSDRGEVLRAEERAYAEVAREHPDWRAKLLATKAQRAASDELQRILLVLGGKAAARTLRDDVRLGEPMRIARSALLSHGGTDEDAEQLFTSLMLEEGLAYDESPDRFAAEFIEETLRTVPALAALDRARVETLAGAFIDAADPSWRRAHELAARSLLEAAWGEGPQPINPEHVADAIESLRGQLGKADAARGIEALRRFLEHVDRAGLLGPQRLRRLEANLSAAALELASGQERPS